MSLQQSDFVNGLRALGLGPGEVVFFHSSLSRLGHVEGGAETVIDALVAAVHPGGTVVAPTFNLIAGDRRANWDVRTTPSTVGLVTETLRHRPEAVRSDHFSHAVAALGPRAQELTRDHVRVRGRDGGWPGAFGPDSPFDKLYHGDAHYLLLGVDFDVCTIFHYVECWLHEDYWQTLDPDAPFQSVERVPLGAAVEAQGLVTRTMIGSAEVRRMSTRQVVDAARTLVLERPLEFLSVNRRDLFRTWARSHGWDPATEPWPGPGNRE